MEGLPMPGRPRKLGYTYTHATNSIFGFRGRAVTIKLWKQARRVSRGQDRAEMRTYYILTISRHDM